MKIPVSFVKEYFKIGLPLILSQLVVYLINNLSVVMMGAISSEAMSGYTCASESFNIYSMLVLGLAGAFHVYIAQYYGDEKRDKYNQILRLGTFFCLALGIVAAVLLTVFSTPFIKIFVDDVAIINYGSDYLKVFCWTFIPYGLNTIWSGAYQVIGKAKIAMVGGVLDCVFNAAFCYLFIGNDVLGLNLGVKGIALALLIARSVESIYLFYKLNAEGSEFAFKFKYDPLKFGEVRRVFITAMPLVINEVLFSFAYMLVTKNYGYASSKYLACYTTVTNVYQLIFVATQGINAVIGVMVGGALGAGDFKTAKDNAKKITIFTFYIYLVCGVLLAASSSIMPTIFSLEGDLAVMTRNMLIAKALIGYGDMSMCFYYILRMGGDTKSVMLLDGVFSCIFPLLVSYLLSHFTNISFLYLYFFTEFTRVLKSLYGLKLVKNGKWIKRLA